MTRADPHGQDAASLGVGQSSWTPSDARPAPGRLDPGLRLYAIGDVHGCLEPLTRLHGLIEADLAARPIARSTLVHLGDLIDRGPDSAGVLAHIASLRLPGLHEVINLLGNHEAMALDALSAGGRDEVDLWLANGGRATLASFGVREGEPSSSWPARIPEASMALLRAMRLTARRGDYLLVHAGINPARRLDAQSPHDLLWIRRPFLNHPGPLPAVVVHGHTPRPLPDVTRYRIGIDTGAVAGGALTCVILEGGELRFLQA